MRVSSNILLRIVGVVGIWALLLGAVSGCGSSSQQSDSIETSPRVINGSPRDGSFPEAVQLYINRGNGWVFCSGAWIGTHTVLTAAHCVVEENGAVVPGNSVVAISDGSQHITSFTSTAVRAHPEFHPGEYVPSEVYPNLLMTAHDAALVEFADSYTGVPAIVSNHAPQSGELLVFVGFGTLGFGSSAVGNGRIGFTEIEDTDPYRIFWRFDGDSESNTCTGDSGGPGYVDFGKGLRLVAITSGGTSTDCKEGDLAFDTRIDAVLPWILETSSGDIAYESN